MTNNDFEDQLFGDLDFEEEEQNSGIPSKPLDVSGIQDKHAEEIKKTLSKTQEFRIASLSSSPRLDPSQIEPPPFWKQKPVMIGGGVVLLLLGVVGGLFAMGIFSSDKGGNQKPNPKRAVVSTKPSLILLKSKPAGAKIFINNVGTRKVTPAQISVPANKTITVQLKLKGHDLFQQKLDGKALKKSGKRVFTWTLAKETLTKKALKAAAKLLPFGYLTLTCTPEKSSVLIGSETKSSCPITKMPLPVGETSIEVKADGFRPKQQSVKIERGKVTTLKVALRKETKSLKGKLRVTIVSSPSSIVYWYNKGKKRRRLGPTPVTFAFPRGKQRLYLRKQTKQGLISMYYRLNVKGEKPFRRRIRFRKGELKFYVRPWADVYINGKKYGQTPIKPLQLYQGRYKVELRMHKLRYRKTIYVRARRDFKFRHTFQRPKR